MVLDNAEPNLELWERVNEIVDQVTVEKQLQSVFESVRE